MISRSGLLLLFSIVVSHTLCAQNARVISGRVLDEAGKPLFLASITVQPGDLQTQSLSNGNFSLLVPAYLQELTLLVTYVGKEPVRRQLRGSEMGQFQLITLASFSLKLADVEVLATRRATTSSNSSLVFDREAIDQLQPLSVANVLNYLPGQTVLRQGLTVQGVQTLNLRSGTNAATLAAAGGSQARNIMETQSLNESFGLTVMVDGSPLSNNANMQMSNTSFMGLFSSNNVTHPDRVLGDRAERNGSLYANYGGLYNGALANTGVDLRTLSVENIEQIEVIGGVASAKYGDYTTGIINIDRQAGVTPLRITLQQNEGTVLSSFSKGIKLSPQLGNLNLNFDYLHSNDDPRDKLKGFERIGGGVLWTVQRGRQAAIKNTLSLNFSTTLDKTRLDPDEGNQRMARFSNRSFNLSNRTVWMLRKPWLQDVEFRASYGVSRSESYDQWFLNGNSVIKINEATETGVYEGRFGPGYYLAYHHIIGKPVNASVRLQTNSLFRIAKGHTYKLSLGIDYRYSDNKGPGVLNDPARPRFDDQGFKNDRPRDFQELAAISNTGVYVENVFRTRFMKRPLMANIGMRADLQNEFFTAAPRINTSWQLAKKWSLALAYGIATKAPGLSQLYPGNVFFDIPLLELYSSTNPEHQLYLVHTEVVKQEKLDLRPYRSETMEAGVTWNGGFLKGSLFYSRRVMNNGFANNTMLVPITVQNYDYDSPVAGEPIHYYPDGTQSTYYLTYNGMRNGNYSRTHSLELILRTGKISALQTSFDLNSALYQTYYRNDVATVSIGGSDGQASVDYTKEALFGVYDKQESKSMTIKSMLSSNTHLPALRMNIVISGEIFWMARTTTLPTSVYPVGYLDRTGNYFPLSAEQARTPEYTHLQRNGRQELVQDQPATIYSNIHLRMSKEMGDVLRLSFNAFNVLNIRPRLRTGTGYFYYNGQPSYSVAMAFSIK